MRIPKKSKPWSMWTITVLVPGHHDYPVVSKTDESVVGQAFASALHPSV
jgi:hypothetical protein